AILSTGDELVQPGESLRDGAVFDANRTLLRAMCESAGARVTADAMIGDDPGAISAWLADAARDADLIVTSGGASVGEPDWVRARLGSAVKGSPSRTLFCRVKMDGDVAQPLPAQSSVVLSNLIPTEGFAIVPPGGLPEGADVNVELL